MTYCQAILGEDELFWTIQIEELTCQCLKIISHRRFEPGTGLRIGLLHRKGAEMLMARAISVSLTSEGKWAITCAFPKKLEVDELGYWLPQDQ
jgi:hypothetical protein